MGRESKQKQMQLKAQRAYLASIPSRVVKAVVCLVLFLPYLFVWTTYSCYRDNDWFWEHFN